MLTLATFNLLDLFATSEAYVAGKAATLGPIVASLDAHAIGFQEVASDDALQAVLSRAGLSGASVVHGTRDARGIGCSLATTLPILEHEVMTTDALPFPVFVEGDPAAFGSRIPLRRGFVSALLDAGELGKVRVFVAHLKSMRAVPLKDARGETVPARAPADYAEGAVRALVWRSAEALALRRAVDRELASARANHVVVMGDLNDVAGSLPLRMLCGRGPWGLLSMGDRVPADERFSILHEGRRETIDHILVSSELARRVASVRFHNESLRDLSGRDLDAPAPLDSDHAPLVARFRADSDRLGDHLP